MKILFDHQGFELQTNGGISRSFNQLIKHLPENIETEIAIRETQNSYLIEDGYRPQGYRREHFITSRPLLGKDFIFRACNKVFHWGYGTDYNQRYSIKKLKKGDFDVFHPTYFDSYFLKYLGKKPFVLTVHDMIPEFMPQYYKPDYYETVKKRKLIDKATTIVTVSHSTKEDLLQVYPHLNPDNIHVVYHGPSFSESLKPIPNPETKKKYLLIVGHRWKYKNFPLFVKHIAPFLHRHPEIKVVCTGQKFFDFEYKLMEENKISGRFESIYIHTDHEFIDLYHNALAAVLPSAMEGFGLPILEAFQAETLCVLNTTKCFREVGGDAPLYFNIEEEESDLSEVMEKAYNLTADERQSIIDRQKGRLKDFSWEKSALELIDVYNRI